MPHLVLEYSDNVTQQVDWSALFSSLHQAVAGVGAPLQNCKSRAIRHEAYHVADGRPGGAFVHLTIGLLAGRTDEVKAALTRRCLELLAETFRPSLGSLDLQISVELRDLHRESYQRLP
ncbi:MAG: 5-carboxymethyl-2-hydroxymuconate Delta-isomerase [Anaerolineae bacterium]|jgi:5-carboxymethyl-2-hydroxymuconate isomerase|nr:5-carboxymethyl-2-hydroxymuconate Delta-isomerase [Anaerolineae bacterium]